MKTSLSQHPCNYIFWKSNKLPHNFALFRHKDMFESLPHRVSTGLIDTKSRSPHCNLKLSSKRSFMIALINSKRYITPIRQMRNNKHVAFFPVFPYFLTTHTWILGIIPFSFLTTYSTVNCALMLTPDEYWTASSVKA